MRDCSEGLEESSRNRNGGLAQFPPRHAEMSQPYLSLVGSVPTVRSLSSMDMDLADTMSVT